MGLAGEADVQTDVSPADVQRPQGYSALSLSYSETREIPATALAVLDLLRRPEPVLGDPVAPRYTTQRRWLERGGRLLGLSAAVDGRRRDHREGQSEFPQAADAARGTL